VKSVPTKPYAVGMAVAAMIAVAGCTGDPKPTGTSSSATPTTSTSAASESTTASSTSTTPNTPASASAASDSNVPAAAEAQNTDGAIALTGYFFALLNQAWTKPQAGLMTPHFTSGCLTCQNFEKNAKDYVANDQRYDRPPVKVIEVSSHGPAKAGPAQMIDVVFTQVAASVVDGTGHTVKSVTQTQGISVVELAWQDDQWKITSIKVQQ